MATEFPTYAVTTEGSDAILAGITFAPVAVTGTTDTLAAADHGRVNYYTDASLVTVTLPTDASDDLADGFECLLVAAGAGGIELDTTGLTLVGSSPTTTAAQNESLFVKKTASANTWIVLGGGSNISDIMTLLQTIDGAGSGLDADLLDGAQGSTYLSKVAAGASIEDIGAVESNVRTVAATGSTETLDTSLYGVFDMTMDQNCEFTFSNPAPSGKATLFTLILRGAFTPTWPASVDWPDATQPTYGTPTVYTFLTVDGGTTWLGASAGKAFG